MRICIDRITDALQYFKDNVSDDISYMSIDMVSNDEFRIKLCVNDHEWYTVYSLIELFDDDDDTYQTLNISKKTKIGVDTFWLSIDGYMIHLKLKK